MHWYSNTLVQYLYNIFLFSFFFKSGRCNSSISPLPTCSFIQYLDVFMYSLNNVVVENGLGQGKDFYQC